MAPPGTGTRPTSDRVREAVFDILGALALAGHLPGSSGTGGSDVAAGPASGPLAGCTVIDVFAGSGALGLEALSRGAVSCAFVESSGAARHALRQNLRALGVPPARVRLLPRDAQGALEDEARAGRRYTLLLADPPYAGYVRYQAVLARALPLLLEPGGLAVIETAREVEPRVALTMLTTKTYGDTRVTVLCNDEGRRPADEEETRACRTK